MTERSTSATTSSQRRRSTLGLVGAASLAAGAALVAIAVPAGAEASISIPIDSVLYAEPGSSTTVANVEVQPSLVGATCDATLMIANQSSVHRGNHLIITTGSTSSVITDVENKPGSVRTGSGQVTLGETVVVSVEMGPDGISSGGLELSFDCEPVVEMPTTTVPTTTVPTTTVPTTTVPTTTVPEVVTPEASLDSTPDLERSPEPELAPAGPALEPNAALPPTPAAVPVAAQPTFTG